MINSALFIQKKTPLILGILLLSTIIVSLGFGSYPIDYNRITEIILHLLGIGDYAVTLKEIAIIEYIRPPRILVATLSGIALGVSGAALQGMMRNPLVEPNLVGVTGGAAFGGVLAIVIGLAQAGTILLSFIGGLGALLSTFTLAKIMNLRSDGIALIMAGFFVGSFCLAGVGFLEFYDKSGALPNIVYWLLGTFRGADFTKLLLISTTTLIGLTVIILLRWRINLLSLGDVDAMAIGIDTRKLRWIIIIIVTFMVSSQVAVSGIIGWVGLIVPHIARMLVGPDHRLLLPTSALLGGLFVLGLDTITRSVTQGEIPVGVLSAFIGTPIVSFIFWKTKTKGWNE